LTSNDGFSNRYLAGYLLSSKWCDRQRKSCNASQFVSSPAAIMVCNLLQAQETAPQLQTTAVVAATRAVSLEHQAALVAAALQVSLL
jgi:hypothetical protein